MVLSKWYLHHPTGLKAMLKKRSSKASLNLYAWIATGHYYNCKNVYGATPQKVADKAFQVSQQAIQNRAAHGNLYRLVTAYRQHGHKQAHLDPLSNPTLATYSAELDPANYGLPENNEKDTLYDLSHILNCAQDKGTLDEVVAILKRVYCGPIAAEFQHLMSEEEREWFAEKFEITQNQENLSDTDKIHLAKEMLKSQVFDNFLATKFGTVKRYGGEGAESMMGFFSQLFRKASEWNVEQLVICMPHRGRLNLLTGMLEYPITNMFRKMKGMCEFPEGVVTTGDVLSHLTSSCDLYFNGRKLHVSMIPNPSHLEAANPVAVGKVRCKQLLLKSGGYADEPEEAFGGNVLCLQVHGDAAFAAQGIVMETLAQANVPHFTVGGSVHLIVNNQLGFTTPADRGRSSPYCSDVAKMIGAPIIHVNADYPEDVANAASLALEYRQRFHKDAFVDLVCFRRWGHNELDDPTFTNPQMYEMIHARQSIPDLYADKLTREGLMSREDAERTVSEHFKMLNDSLNKLDSFKPPTTHLLGGWKDMMASPPAITVWDTGLDLNILKYIGGRSVHVTDDFNVHPHLHKTHIQNRLKKMSEGTGIDWATGEALAIGSLLYQGFNVRLSGQDVGRGTFSHRHAMLVDQKTGSLHIPLNHMMENQAGKFEVANCILSEEAVLGFEYGMSIESPNNLIIWEAQFGDFFNGAQIIIDTFIASAETKWLLQSGLVMLLPHGYDGAGPEHSSCRVERFLQLCDSKEDAADGDDVNIHIAAPTTPAQYFHLLRRQMVRNFKKPLIVVAPKLLLRLPTATSTLAEMAPGTSFQAIYGDSKVNPDGVKRVVVCSGKHYYALDKHRETNGIKDTAIIRLELLCPFPTKELQEELKKYTSATRYVWSQEEHQNMGPWSFIAPRFENIVGYKLTYAGRRPLATPAVGIGKIHQEEAQSIVSLPFEK